MGRKKTFRGLYDFKPSSRIIGGQSYFLQNTNFGQEIGTFTSVKTPNFKSIRKRDLPQHPHYAECLDVHYGPAKYIEKNPYVPDSNVTFVNWRFNINGYIAAPFIGGEQYDDLNNQVRLKVKNKKVDLAVMGGEMRQTARFLDLRIGGVIRLLNKQSLGRLIRSNLYWKKNFRFRDRPVRRTDGRSSSFRVSQVPYKRGIDGKWIKNPYYNDKQHADISAMLANTWLEYSYALRPLLNDVYGAAEAIANVPYAVNRNVAKATLKKSESRMITVPSDNPGLLGYWNCTYSSNGSKSIGVVFYRDNPLSSLAALGLTNPLSLAWELVTLSFVIDWFLPIGKTLDSLDAVVGCTFGGGYSVEKGESSASCFLKLPTNSFFEGEGSAEVRNSFINRVVLTEFPGVTLPSFRWPETLSQAASGVALLSQLFKR